MKNIFQFFVSTFIFIQIIIPYTNLYSQNNKTVFEHFSTEQGFSQGVVFSILQDSKGFMWFGSENGLIRYDGYKFKVFKHNPDDEKSLSSNIVISIYEDRSGVYGLERKAGD